MAAPIFRIEIKATGMRGALRRFMSMVSYFDIRIIKDMREMGNIGVEVLRQAIATSGIRSRTGGLLQSVEIQEVTEDRVVIGFGTVGEKDYAPVASVLESGKVIPAPGKKDTGAYRMFKGPGEGVVFRRGIYKARVIPAFGFMEIAIGQLSMDLPSFMRTRVIQDVRGDI